MHGSLFLWPKQVSPPNGNSIGSAIFAQHTGVINTQTDTLTTLHATAVATSCIYAVQVTQSKNFTEAEWLPGLFLLRIISNAYAFFCYSSDRDKRSSGTIYTNEFTSYHPAAAAANSKSQKTSTMQQTDNQHHAHGTYNYPWCHTSDRWVCGAANCTPCDTTLVNRWHYNRKSCHSLL